MTTTLNELSLGEFAIIERIEGNDSIAMRLMEMGLFEGESVQMVGKAPLGDPREYLICGCLVSLRKAETLRVFIQKQDSTSVPA